MFSERPINSSQSDAEVKAKLYYQSCMDANKTIEKLGSKPLEDLIKKFGGWTISNRTGVWSEEKWTLQKAVEDMKEFGIFFNYFVGEDDKNSSQNILQVSFFSTFSHHCATREFYTLTGKCRKTEE